MRGDDISADEYKYLPVRRLALHIEECVSRGIAWAAFEPNDEALWAQLRLNVNAFMHSLFRQGAFQGASAQEAWFVRCDAQTHNRNDLDRGICNMTIGFAPLKPAEFVVLRLSQVTSSAPV
jgi:phage tail sheath protein FI